MIQQFIFLFVVFIIGFCVLLFFKDRILQAYIFLLAFPMGLIVWTLIILVLEIFGIAPVKPLIWCLDGLVLISMVAFHVRKKNYSSIGIKSVGIVLILYILLALGFITFNYSYLSNDSWLLIIGGKNLVSSGGLPEVLLTLKGIVSYIILSSSYIFGFSYPNALFPILSLSLILTFFYGLYTASGYKKIQFNTIFIFNSLAVIFLVSGYFVFFNIFYVISNSLAAAFLFFSIFGLYQRLQTGVWFWTLFSCLNLVGFSLSRLETNIFVLPAIIIILSRKEIPEREKLLYVSPIVIICLLWFFRLANLLSNYNFREAKSGYNYKIITVLIAVYLFVFIYSMISRFRPFKSMNPYLPYLMIVVLTASWVYLLFTKGLFVRGSIIMIMKKYGDLVINILKDGSWAIIWIGLIFLMVIAVLLKKIKFESVFLYYIISFFLLFNTINLYRFGWRRGWGDSGNRMLLHVVFIIAFYIFLKFAYFLFDREQLNES